MRRRNTTRRILAIDPTHRGFGYVVLEGSDRLVDWGLRQWRRGKSSNAVDRVCNLIRRVTPDVLVIEDTRCDSCRRGERVREFLDRVAAATISEVRVRRVAAAAVRARFSAAGAKNKDAVARILAAQFPELAPLLPPPRKPWKSEDERMAVFDAAALAANGARLHSRPTRPLIC